MAVKRNSKRTGPSKRTAAERAAIDKRADGWKPAKKTAKAAKPKQPKLPRPIITIAGQPTRWPREIKQTKIVKRKELSKVKVEALMRSINERGCLLHPIPIRASDNEMIAGQHRLAAWTHPDCKFRKEPIPVHLVDIDSILQGERDENEHRHDMAPSEKVALYRAIEAEWQERAAERQRAGKKVAEGEKGGAADLIAAYLGRDRKTLTRAREVVEAAERDPEKYAPLVEQMDKSGKVSGAWRRLQVHEQVKGIKARQANGTLSIPEGSFDRIVADMPWPYEPDDEQPAERGRAVHAYATMSIKQMKALPIAERCAENVVCYFAVTNFHMEYAYQVLRAWGFTEFPVIITWLKDKFGRGQRLRNITEHWIVAIKGKPVWQLTNQTTLIEGPVRAESEKPESFYALIDEITPAERSLELFARRVLPEGWVGFGDQVGTLAAAKPVASVLEALEAIARGEEVMLDGEIARLVDPLVKGKRKKSLNRIGKLRLEQLRATTPPAPASTAVRVRGANGTLTSTAIAVAKRKADEIPFELIKPANKQRATLVWRKDRQFVFERFLRGELMRGAVFLELTAEGIEIEGYVDAGMQHFYDADIPVAKVDKLIKAWGKAPVAAPSPRRGEGSADDAAERMGEGPSDLSQRPEPPHPNPLPFGAREPALPDCRVCADGQGICAQCIAAAEHDITGTNDSDETVICSCGWHSAPGTDWQVATREHWQNVVAEYKAAEASVVAEPDQLAIPPSLRRPLPEAAE